MSEHNQGQGISAIKNDPRTEEQQRADYERYCAALKEPNPNRPRLEDALREAREHLIKLRDRGAEHPDTQRIIDSGLGKLHQGQRPSDA